MFKLIDQTAPRRVITLRLEGREIHASQGDTVAMALLLAGVTPFRRTPVSGAPRAPLCLMGVCFDCLVDVDGHRNVQSCMVEVREGMSVTLPMGAAPKEGAE